MTTYSKDIIIADLQSKFDRISEKDTDQFFYFKLADYGKYLLTRRTTRDILKPLQKDAKKSLESYDKVFQKFIIQWKDYTSDLLSHAKKLPSRDSNPDCTDQNRECYHYTTGHIVLR